MPPVVRTVTYHGVAVRRPGGWPVYDLAADPSTCVRFDVNAVYLGHPGADMACPAEVDRPRRRGAGRAESTAGAARMPAQRSARRPAAIGERARGAGRRRAATASSEVAAEFPTAGVSATLTLSRLRRHRPADPRSRSGAVAPMKRAAPRRRGDRRGARGLPAAAAAASAASAAGADAVAGLRRLRGAERVDDDARGGRRRTRASASTSAAPTAACAQPNLDASRG